MATWTWSENARRVPFVSAGKNKCNNYKHRKLLNFNSPFDSIKISKIGTEGVESAYNPANLNKSRQSYIQTPSARGTHSHPCCTFASSEVIMMQRLKHLTLLEDKMVCICKIWHKEVSVSPRLPVICDC